MSTRLKFRPFFFIVGILILGLIIIIPLMVNYFNLGELFDPIINNYENIHESLTRSLIFSTVSSILNVFISFIIALNIRKISANTIYGKLLSWLLLPFILGGISTAYIYKVLLLDSTILGLSSENLFVHYSLLLLIQFWQFGLLFIYLFWLNFKGLSNNTLLFAASVKLSSWEKTKDVLVPHSKNLGILLFLFSYSFSFFESTNSNFIFKSSQGNNRELISHWLSRVYYSGLKSAQSYEDSLSTVTSSSVLVFIINLFCFFIVSFLLYLLIQYVIQKRTTNNVRSIKQPVILFIKKEKLLFLFLLAIILLPIVFTYLHTGIRTPDNWSQLLTTIYMSIIAGSVASFITIFMAIQARLLFKSLLSSFNFNTLLFFTVLFLLLLIPPLSVFLSVLEWRYLLVLNQDSVIIERIIWIISHTILIFPLLTSFIIVIQFKVKYNELIYLNIIKLPYIQVLKKSFFQRFKAEYILTLILSVAIIWNESTINIALSEFVPSYASLMKISFEGKNPDWGEASLFLLVSIIFCSVFIIIWQLIQTRYLHSK